jgi:ligand-binding SRPBCC domain-containing protein
MNINSLRPHADTIRVGRCPVTRRFTLEATQWLPANRDKVFEFFSDAHQLETITPPWLRFVVLTPRSILIQAGTLIDYRLRLHGVGIAWQSRIDVWEPPARFVDLQTRGPYRLWHHEHLFVPAGEGTNCLDIVHYRVPGGTIVNSLFVRRDLLKIFAFRQNKLRELFPANP